jgi:hypothetical protein
LAPLVTRGLGSRAWRGASGAAAWVRRVGLGTGHSARGLHRGIGPWLGSELRSVSGHRGMCRCVAPGRGLRGSAGVGRGSCAGRSTGWRCSGSRGARWGGSGPAGAWRLRGLGGNGKRKQGGARAQKGGRGIPPGGGGAVQETRLRRLGLGRG